MAFSQENLIQQPEGKSIVAAVSSNYHHSKECQKYIKLFKDINFRGLVMVEIRKNSKYDYMIEANPRFWGPSQLFVDSRVNLFDALLFDYGVIEEKPQYLKPRKAEYFWFGGLVETFKCNKNVNFYNYTPKKFFKQLPSFLQIDIYRRDDSINIFLDELGVLNNNVKKLRALYFTGSKHSNYQMVYKKLLPQLQLNNNLVSKPKYEMERLDFIVKNIDIKGKTVLDIGSNTGFFAFSLIEKGAKRVICYEGNKKHAEFIMRSANCLNIGNNKIKVVPNYYNFRRTTIHDKVDIVLLMNVLHHLGDDYGDKHKKIDFVKKEIIKQINYLADKTSFLILQLGFNWKGNIRNCLFEKGTKKEMIDYIYQGTKNNWEIENIGIAEKIEDKIIYDELNENNILRDDSLGEFLNRPIFMLRSKINKI